mmetsp:Transcript_6943/g.13876  ORF Transcript_6943/g.13876 Transcript_6943/m.13876 type:complete len:234 (-) Transcript_6943:546-1247(-)
MTHQLTAHQRALVVQVESILDDRSHLEFMLEEGGDEVLTAADFRVFIDTFKEDAKSILISLFCEIHGISIETAQNLLLHAAAEFKVSHRNISQMIRDYGELINHSYPEQQNGSLPLHIACAAAGREHRLRLEAFMIPFPQAVKIPDINNMTSLQIALIHGADVDVIKLLIDSYRPALMKPFLPNTTTSDLEPLVGMLPFHIACCRSRWLDVIYQILVESQSDVICRITNRQLP